MPYTVFRDLLSGISKKAREDIVREANVPERELTDIVIEPRGIDTTYDKRIDCWGKKLLPYILYRVDPSDDQIMQLVRGEFLSLPEDLSLQQFGVVFEYPESGLEGSAPVTELAACGIAVTLLCRSLIATNQVCGVDIEMPAITKLSLDSVGFELMGSGCLGLGFGLLWAIGTGAVVAPAAPIVAGVIGGVLLVGAIREVLSSKKQVAETRKLDADAALSVAEAHKADAEARRADAEAKKAEAEARKANAEASEAEESARRTKNESDTAALKLEKQKRAEATQQFPSHAPPASSYSTMAGLNLYAEKFHLPLSYAIHVANRNLPVIAAVLQALPNHLISFNPRSRDSK